MDRFLDRVDTDRFYVPVEFARQATRSRDQFNVVDKRTGWKVDLVIRKDRPFSRSEFGRRQRVDLAGVDVFVATAEDTVLAKLEWADSTDSDRQIRDVVDLLRTIGDRLDHDHLDYWAGELHVRHALDRVRKAAYPRTSNGPIADT